MNIENPEKTESKTLIEVIISANLTLIKIQDNKNKSIIAMHFLHKCCLLLKIYTTLLIHCLMISSALLPL